MNLAFGKDRKETKISQRRFYMQVIDIVVSITNEIIIINFNWQITEAILGVTFDYFYI